MSSRQEHSPPPPSYPELAALQEVDGSHLVTVDSAADAFGRLVGRLEEEDQTAMLPDIIKGLNHPGLYLQLLDEDQANQVLSGLSHQASLSVGGKKEGGRDRALGKISELKNKLPEQMRDKYIEGLAPRTQASLDKYENGARYSPGILRRMGAKVMSIAMIPLKPINAIKTGVEQYRRFRDTNDVGLIRHLFKYGLRSTRLEWSTGMDWRAVPGDNYDPKGRLSHRTRHDRDHAIDHDFGMPGNTLPSPHSIKMRFNTSDLSYSIKRGLDQGGLRERFPDLTIDVPKTVIEQNQMRAELSRLMTDEFIRLASERAEALKNQQLSNLGDNPDERARFIEESYNRELERIVAYSEEFSREGEGIKFIRGKIVDYFIPSSPYSPTPSSFGADLKVNISDHITAAALAKYAGLLDDDVSSGLAA